MVAQIFGMHGYSFFFFFLRQLDMQDSQTAENPAASFEEILDAADII